MKVEVYKVVRRGVDERRFSAYARGELCVVYNTDGKPTLPPHPSLPLTAFDSKKDAARFWTSENTGDFEIWRATAELTTGIPLMDYKYTITDALKDINIRASRVRPWDAAFEAAWPQGTVFCSSITLIATVGILTLGEPK